MFDDAIRAKGLSESVTVRDIAEVLSGTGKNKPV
jgi:hypothetical protein